MDIREIDFATPEFDEAVQLRYEILRKPLGLEYTPEQLAEEYNQFHLAAFAPTGQLMAYLNLTPVDDQTIKMRQVAVASERQGKGIGQALVAYAENFAKQRHFKTMVLHARESACPFYLKLDYETVGKRFEEVTIPHFKMQKHL